MLFCICMSVVTLRIPVSRDQSVCFCNVGGYCLMSSKQKESMPVSPYSQEQIFVTLVFLF